VRIPRSLIVRAEAFMNQQRDESQSVASSDDDQDSENDNDIDENDEDENGEDVENDEAQYGSTSRTRLRIARRLIVGAESLVNQRHDESRVVTSRTRSRPIIRAPARLTVVHTSSGRKSTEPQKPDTSFKTIVEHDSKSKKKKHYSTDDDLC